MTVAIVVALAVGAVVVSPPAVRLFDRKAGWPLAALLAAGAVTLASQLPGILSGEPLVFEFTWVPDALGSGADLDFALKADALGAFFALLALSIGTVVFVYSAAYLPRGEGNTSFYTIMTAFTLSIVLLVLANDVVVLFIAWELVSLASFMLIARSGSSGERGSMRTLVLTFFGGLTLLVALMIAATQAGTTRLDAILASDVWAERPGVATAVALLVAVSAFTKSAQLPFHFWLPEAMAAATPVSAFLHAAAVVKAGVYVLLRFSTVFSDVPAWNWLLIWVGIVTAVVSAFFAIQKTDMKKLTAYSTVSHLGWIVATIGVGTPLALGAAVVHTLAHALFKSSLFMLIGVVDHENGTRDIARLGSIWRKMPFTFASAAVGVASMAAIPPTFGFVSKEGMLEAFQDAPVGAVGVGLLLTLAAIGALLTFTYSAKYLVGAFIDPARDPDRDEPEVHEAPVSLWLPAALPGLLSLPVGLAPWLLDDVVDAVVASTGAEAHTHLSLWHGITLPLVISVVVIALGAVGVAFRHRIWAAVEGELLPFSGNSLLKHVNRSFTHVGRPLAKLADSFSPSRHIVWPVGLAVALVAVTLFAGPGIDGVSLPDSGGEFTTATDVVPLAIVAIAVVGLAISHSRLTSVVLLGVAGVGVTLQMLMLSVPDVALTQLLVEAIVVVIFMLVVRYQPRSFPRPSRARAARSAIIALAAGAAAFIAVWAMMGRNGRSELAQWYLDNAPAITEGDNIVATIIVEFRALDTLGELSVLGMAALVITSVVRSAPRMPFFAGTRPNPLGQSQLNSVPMAKVFTLLAPVLLVLSVIVFWRGHGDPGGGFIAALIAAAGMMLLYLAQGRDSILFRPSTPIWLVAVGVALAVATGLIGYAEGSFLRPLYAHVGDVHLTTSLLFDGGIYLAVVGMLLAAINALGGYLRPGVGSVEELDYARVGGPLPDTPALSFPEEITTADHPEPFSPTRSANDGGPERTDRRGAVSRTPGRETIPGIDTARLTDAGKED
ncbi:DUF4040 family protein [Corynebacterium otitidis]|uniref:DUF4040 family protein n=1 Tax=Corynebacterium otitidis TaxID=29321 RepID=UPI000627BC46|nr:DUF4040 family protein [Corynebacterium otitidis]KKO84275.1 monovalent cation/H+ antiporter subunit A [Corynebacterium otitidis]